MSHRKEFRKSIAFLLITIITLLIVGALLFSFLEHWSFLNAFYFVAMTATTVGYGDFVPSNNISKIFTILYSLSIVPFVLYLFTIVAKYNVGMVIHKMTRLEHKQHVQEEELEMTSHNLERQRKKLKEQEIENEKQEELIKKQKSEIKKTSKKLDLVQDVVTDVVGEVLINDPKTNKKSNKK